MVTLIELELIIKCSVVATVNIFDFTEWLKETIVCLAHIFQSKQVRELENCKQWFKTHS